MQEGALAEAVGESVDDEESAALDASLAGKKKKKKKPKVSTPFCISERMNACKIGRSMLLQARLCSSGEPLALISVLWTVLSSVCPTAQSHVIGIVAGELDATLMHCCSPEGSLISLLIEVPYALLPIPEDFSMQLCVIPDWRHWLSIT